MMMKKTLVVGALLGGCTVMVNGKPHRIGGSTDEAKAEPAKAEPAKTQQAKQPTQTTPTTETADVATQPAAPPPPPAPVGKAYQVPLATLTSEPVVFAASAAFDTSWSKVFGFSSVSPNCGNQLPSQPIATFELAEPSNELTIAVTGARNDGYIVRSNSLYWTNCESIEMGPVKGGWKPGRYEIFPVARYDYEKGAAQPFTVEFYNPQRRAPWDDAKKITISKRLDKPMFVEVTTKPNRKQLRDGQSGDRCSSYALPFTPDIALSIERPIPGLTIRPLPSPEKVTLRREMVKPRQQVITGNATYEKWCITDSGRRDDRYSSDARPTKSGVKPEDKKAKKKTNEAEVYEPKQDLPSYVATSEVHFDNNDEGEYGISLGTADAQKSTTVTLMIFDDSTFFDEMTVRPFGGDSPTLQQRWIGVQMPQFSTRQLERIDNYADLELASKVFASLPKQALVYSKLDLDKDIAWGESETFPKKNEPLAVLDFEGEQVDVLTADGVRFRVKKSHVLLAPDGAMAIPTAPRELARPKIGEVIALLPPSAKKLGEAHYKKVEAFERCRDNAWAPYGRQLPTISRPSNVDVVVVKNAAYNQIEDAGERAMNSKCGTQDAFEKKTEVARKKLMVEVDKGRAKLLVEATAQLK